MKFKKIISTLCALVAIVIVMSFVVPCCFSYSATSNNAKDNPQTDVKSAKVQTFIKSGNVDTYDLEYDIIEITLNQPAVIYITFDLWLDEELDDLNAKHGLKFALLKFDSEMEEYSSKIDSFKMNIPKGEDYDDWWYHSDEVLPAGHYGIKLEKTNEDDYLECKYKVYTYSGFAESITVPSTVNVKTDGETAFYMENISPEGTLTGASWTSSNKKIAEVYSDHKSTVWVYGNKQGKCTLTGELVNGKTYKCTVKVTNPAPKVNYKIFELYKGETDQVKLKYIKGKTKWKSSNPKIASVTKNGKIKAKKLGKCTVSTKYKGKTYKATVKVVYQWPNFTAELTDYNTRGNYFVVKFKNKSNKSVTVLSQKARCMDVDYKTFDRNLQLLGNKNIIIKPKKSKTVKFKVKGGSTWPNYSDFTIRYYFKFDGKKYLGSCWDEDSCFKKGKTWYATYWRED